MKPILVIFLAMLTVSAQNAASGSQAAPGWIARSNQSALLLLRTTARFDPESASTVGLNHADDQITDLNPGFRERRRAAVSLVERQLKDRLAQEKDPLVAQDLEILIKSAALDVKGSELRERYEIPYHNVVEVVFNGIHGLLDDQTAPERRPVALVRWGLYSEYIMFPYMPPDGQLVSLQYRLQRAARAFIDPELQMGKLTPEEGRRILTQEVGLSQPFANSEIERYTFRMPGQANSYFYGYMRLLELRNDVEKAMGHDFNQQKFHDFIMAQGLLSPDQLRRAVFQEFAGKGKS